MDGTTISKESSRTTPYDTGKIKIGLYYEPPKPPLEQDELLLQHALLGIVPPKETFFQRLISRLMKG
jgi:hypothetical protein